MDGGRRKAGSVGRKEMVWEHFVDASPCKAAPLAIRAYASPSWDVATHGGGTPRSTYHDPMAVSKYKRSRSSSGFPTASAMTICNQWLRFLVHESVKRRHCAPSVGSASDPALSSCIAQGLRLTEVKNVVEKERPGFIAT